jgi:two-component system, OmpR family, sensor histidine kinase MprB
MTRRLASVSFRARIALASAAAVALAIVVASAVVYLVARAELRAPIEEALEERANELYADPPGTTLAPGGPYLGLEPEFGQPGFVQRVPLFGRPAKPLGQAIALPIDERTLDVAAGTHDWYFSDATVEGQHLRVLTFNVVPGVAMQVARPLTEVDASLDRLALMLLLIATSGIAGAAVLGLLVSRTALSPVTRLTETAERVTVTGDLSERIEVEGGDELSRLASSFNTMLAALEDSTRAQRQLVADASHELRTPLTSLRTNIEVLAGNQRLPGDERTRLLSDVVEQLEEMTNLISELIELAHAEQHTVEPEEVRLDAITADAIERVRRNRPGVVFSARLEESVVQGVPATLERAIGNLLDNAAKWSPPGAPVEVVAKDGFVVVRDRGPGIAEEDLPYVFDRFYRARSARGMPGSGLGLAIVRQVAEAHGGEVVAEQAAGGGTRMTLRLGNARAGEPTSELVEPTTVELGSS